MEDQRERERISNVALGWLAAPVRVVSCSARSRSARIPCPQPLDAALPSFPLQLGFRPQSLRLGGWLKISNIKTYFRFPPSEGGNQKESGVVKGKVPCPVRRHQGRQARGSAEHCRRGILRNALRLRRRDRDSGRPGTSRCDCCRSTPGAPMRFDWRCCSVRPRCVHEVMRRRLKSVFVRRTPLSGNHRAQSHSRR